MNKIPSILVDTGFEVDQNGNLTGIIVTDKVTTLTNQIDVTTNCETIAGLPFLPESVLTFTGRKMRTLSLNYNLFTASHSNLSSVSFPDVTEVTVSSDGHLSFQNSHISSINIPNLETITTSGRGMLCEDAFGVTTLEFPKFKQFVQNGTYGCFFRMTGLINVTLGSEGNPVTAMGNAFQNCTQTGLTITIYTSGGAALAGEPWGATNATIEYEEA